jgi:pimeloyl-ACP methyl ester carboxylesterase
MKPPVLILHGWGKDVTGQKYRQLAEILQKKGFDVYTPDLPGFGTTPLGKNALIFADYVAFVTAYITKTIRAKKVIVIGHSFGGRIAIRFTALHPDMVEKLILVDASGIPQKLSLKKQLVALATKVGVPLFRVPPFSVVYGLLRKIVYRSIGEMDYYKAGNLTETFKNVYRVSIVSDLPAISVPTLIVWGGKDTFTPLSCGKAMHAAIKHSKFVIIQDATHRLPYENPTATAQTIISFLS